VAQEIAKIEALHRTSVAPRLVRDDAAGLFRVEAETPLPDGVLAFARDRIGLALDAALAALPNGFKPRQTGPAGWRLAEGPAQPGRFPDMAGMNRADPAVRRQPPAWRPRVEPPA
jgi:hypothetical protein